MENTRHIFKIKQVKVMIFKSKKALTLVEVLVSITILTLISLTLLGVIVSSANAQSTAQARNSASYKAAAQLEKKMYSMQTEGTDLSDTNYISTQAHTLVINIGGEQILCEGLIVESTDPKTSVHMRGFYPDEN